MPSFHDSFVAFLLALAIVFESPASDACAAIPRDGERVRISNEDALIVWDEKKKTQHFIRRATFDTQAKDFGFLVPTPSVPELAEADDAVFVRLSAATARKIVEKEETEYQLSLFLLSRPDKTAGMPLEAASVRVLHEQRVGGLDAVVLEADDPEALAQWLEKHEYPSSPDLERWLERYVEDEWKITAFKIADEKSGQRSLGTSAVRMSFRTERPFFPYREPESAKRADPNDPLGGLPSRLLRVYVVSNGRVSGTIDQAEFAGRTVYSAPLDPSVLGKDVPGDGLEGAWVTKIDDAANPRPGDAELYFTRSEDPSEVIPPPRIQTKTNSVFLPLDLAAGLLLLGGGVAWVVTRRRKDEAGA